MTKNGTFLARQKLLVSEHFQIQKLACQGEERKTPPFRAEIAPSGEFLLFSSHPYHMDILILAYFSCPFYLFFLSFFLFFLSLYQSILLCLSCPH
ncbi:MAG: hypothetical protein R6U32_06930 [Candidatus Woesearchaeota archaeon]